MSPPYVAIKQNLRQPNLHQILCSHLKLVPRSYVMNDRKFSVALHGVTASETMQIS